MTRNVQEELSSKTQEITCGEMELRERWVNTDMHTHTHKEVVGGCSFPGDRNGILQTFKDPFPPSY